MIGAIYQKLKLTSIRYDNTKTSEHVKLTSH